MIAMTIINSMSVKPDDFFILLSKDQVVKSKSKASSLQKARQSGYVPQYMYFLYAMVTEKQALLKYILTNITFLKQNTGR